MTSTQSPEECVRAGRLGQALHELQNRVRAQPADAKDRLFLFQLLALLGQWNRAATQLGVASDLDPSLLILKQIYAQAIHAESLRTRVFAGEVTPLILGEPPAWMAGLIESVRLEAQGHSEHAVQVRAQALEEAPAIAGEVNGEAFAWIADADSRLGPCLEIIVDGKYMWAPFERVQQISIEPPTDLRDLIWASATVQWRNGGQTPAVIPARYVGAEDYADDALRMARRTEWSSPQPDTFVGQGQRMFATDTSEYPLLEIRELKLAAMSS